MNIGVGQLERVLWSAIACLTIVAVGCAEKHGNADERLQSTSSQLHESSSDGGLAVTDRPHEKRCEEKLRELLERKRDLQSECALQDASASEHGHDRDCAQDLRELTERENDLADRCHAFGQMVGARGGTVIGPNEAQVMVPVGALDRPTFITVAANNQAPPLTQALPVGPTLVLNPEGQQFLLPVSVVLPFDPASLPSGATENDLAVYTAPAGSKDYQALPTRIIDSTHVSGQTTHFSNVVLGVLGSGIACQWCCSGGKSAQEACECQVYLQSTCPAKPSDSFFFSLSKCAQDSRCQEPCALRPTASCQAQGANCGIIDDGCGAVDCGGCTPPEWCGGGGPHQCGQPASSAQYTYTGNQFLYIGGCCGVSQVSGSFTVPSALAPNTTYNNLASTITAYSFTDGRYTWTPSNYPGGPVSPFNISNEFFVRTDAQGQIASWQIDLVSDNPVGEIFTQSADFAAGGGPLDSVNVYNNYDAYSYAPGNPNGQQGVPGTWH